MAANNLDLLDKMTPATKGKSVKDVLTVVHQQLIKSESSFAAALGDNLSAKKFAYVVYTYVRRNPHLWECDPQSICAGAMEAAELGLNFSIRNEAHLVPYGGKAVFQPGYKGLMKLGLNDPRIQSLHAYAVCQNDEFNIELGGDPKVTHRPPLTGRGEIVAFYAVAKDHKGNQIPEVLTVEEVEAWAKKYIKPNKGPFSQIKTLGRKGENFEAYGLKTVILRLCNRKLPLSTELSRAIEAEFESTQDGIDKIIEAIPTPSTGETKNALLEAPTSSEPDFARDDDELSV